VIPIDFVFCKTANYPHNALPDETASDTMFEDIVGSSIALQKVLRDLET
jgi:hypothetical protein